MEKAPILAIDRMEVVYHAVSAALHGVTLQVRENQVTVLLGNNGAGKTTTLRAVSGFLGLDGARVSGGSIRFRGEEIQNNPPHVITKKGIVLVPERDKVFESLTVEENLRIGIPGRSYKKDEDAAAFVRDNFPILTHLMGRISGYLSGGERQILAIASALYCGPDLLLVDELSLGLAPIIVGELMGLLKKIRDEQRVTILLVEQNASAALEIADFGYVIENGRIVLAGEKKALADQREIQEFYLGRGERTAMKSYKDVKQYRHTRRWYG